MMGMYDSVEGEFKCPKCGHLQTDFQTKQHDCILDTLDFRICDYFYSSCDNCGVWLDVTLSEDARKQIYGKIAEMRMALTPEHYEVTAQTTEECFGEINEESKEKTPDSQQDENKTEGN